MGPDSYDLTCQVEMLAEKFDLDPRPALKLIRKRHKLPIGAEFRFAVPRHGALSFRKYASLPSHRRTGEEYCHAVRRMITTLGIYIQWSQDFDLLTPEHVTMKQRTRTMLRKVEVEQPGSDILILSGRVDIVAGLSGNHTIESAEKQLSRNQFLFSSVMGLAIFSTSFPWTYEEFNRELGCPSIALAGDRVVGRKYSFPSPVGEHVPHLDPEKYSREPRLRYCNVHHKEPCEERRIWVPVAFGPDN